jgi:nitrogen fixation NifU-like protein
MSDLRELYQSVILDHNKHPRNFGELEAANRSADGFNPLCGDKVTVELEVAGECVKDVAFSGSGCAISTASASLMTQIIKGKTLAEVDALFEGFHDLVTSNPSEPIDTSGLGKLAVFGGVREFPVRVKCATLAWHTLKAALDEADRIAKTE